MMALRAGPHAPSASLGEPGFRKPHELVQDSEFEFEFDGVDHWFYGRFAGVFARELEDDEDEVHADADDVDEDELDHDFARHAVVDGAEDANGVFDVEDRDEGFLEAEAHELDAFHDVEFGLPEIAGALGGGVDADGEDDGGDVEDKGVDDNEAEDVAERFLIAEDEMEAREEDKGLAGDHGHPADFDKGEVDVPVGADEETEDECQGMEDASP